VVCAIAVWFFYGAILQGQHLFRLAPRRVAMLCVIAFSAAVSVLWAITFVAQKLPA
jgi:Na+/proline symporter